MTRKRLRRLTVAIMIGYGAAIVLGIALRVANPDPNDLVYQTYKDLIPLIIALPATFLAYAFQRRAIYVQGLRALWTHMVDAIAAAITYTDLPTPTAQQYADTLRGLSGVIEEVRGFYANVPAAPAPDGWYPFEPVKRIYAAVRELGYGDGVTPERRARTREVILALWKRNRARFLAELDVEVPTHHHAGYAALPEDLKGAAP